MTGKAPNDSPRRDYGFIAIAALVLFNAVWLLLMPAIPAIASTTLHRFHLRSRSFSLWAIQFPIPSMYNFANTFSAQTLSEGMDTPSESDKRYLNHFPVRVFTFADGRYRYLRQGESCWFTIESSYRGQTLESHFHLRPRRDAGSDTQRTRANRGFDLIRLPTTEPLARGTTGTVP